MKRIRAWIRAIIPHISIICTGMMLTFLVIEVINPYAGFINHRYTKIVLWIWVVSAAERDPADRRPAAGSSPQPAAAPARGGPR